LSKELKISVVTSCYNGESYVENTIKSILYQGYQNLEYIFIDAASTDETLQIARKDIDNISVLVSEPDDGQYHGIQKGLSMASGEIMAWLNADDIYLPWTFSIVNQIFKQYPNVDWIIGLPSFLNPQGQCVRISGNAGSAFPQTFIQNGWFRSHLAGYLQQESMFWTKRLWDKVGGLNLTFKYAADYELWTRFAMHAELVSVTVPLGCFRQLPGIQKSSVEIDKYESEVIQVNSRLKPAPYLWDTIARRGVTWRCLCRLLIWKASKYIAYSSSKQKWELKENLRPLSRASIADLSLERSLL
jgi:hypothetical protein